MHVPARIGRSFIPVKREVMTPAAMDVFPAESGRFNGMRSAGRRIVGAVTGPIGMRPMAPGGDRLLVRVEGEDAVLNLIHQGRPGAAGHWRPRP